MTTEPIISLGIAGSVIQICTKNIGKNTTTLAIQYYFSNVLDKDQETSIQLAKKQSGILHITIILLSIPLTVIMAWLTTKYRTEWLLVISDLIVLAGGIGMIANTHQAGTWQFMASYLVS